jgi:hypothetical protein
LRTQTGYVSLERTKKLLIGGALRAGILISALVLSARALPARTIRVDITPEHVANTMCRQRRSAAIDRLPYGAADNLYVDSTLKQVLSAGWQTVTYRQNTELMTEAWHWNPNGTYAALRPDGLWSLMIVNGDQENAHTVRIVFRDDKARADRHFAGQVNAVTFGSAQYQYHPSQHGGGKANPDGPAVRSTINAAADTLYELPKTSITVLRGNIAPK